MKGTNNLHPIFLPLHIFALKFFCRIFFYKFNADRKEKNIHHRGHGGHGDVKQGRDGNPNCFNYDPSLANEMKRNRAKSERGSLHGSNLRVLQ